MVRTKRPDREVAPISVGIEAVEHPEFRYARAPARKGRPRTVTPQRVRAAPLRVQDAIRRLGKPLSKMTRHDWFAIACEASEVGIMERQFQVPAAKEEPKRSVGRPRKYRAVADQELLAFLVDTTHNEQGQRVLSDREALRLLCDAVVAEKSKDLNLSASGKKRLRQWVESRALRLSKRASLLRKQAQASRP